MSNLSDLLPAGGGAKVITATASGNLATGQTVALQSNGTIKAVEQTSVSATAGSATTYDSGDRNFGNQNRAIAYDSTNDRVVIAYRDSDNSNYGTAVVGAVSGTSISFGSVKNALILSVKNLFASFIFPPVTLNNPLCSVFSVVFPVDDQ